MKTLTIKETVYNELVSLKKAKESFSSLFERLAKKEKTSITGFAGFLSNESAVEMKKSIGNYRKSTENLDKERTKRIEKTW